MDPIQTRQKVNFDLLAFYPENDHIKPKKGDKMALFVNIFLLFGDICTHACGVPSLLGCKYSINWFFTAFYTEIFLAKKAQKGRKLHHLVIDHFFLGILRGNMENYINFFLNRP